MSNFWQRLVTGIVFIAVMVSAILIGPATLFAFGAVAAAIGISEYHRILTHGKLPLPSKWLALIAAVFVFAISWQAVFDGRFWALVPFIWMMLLTIELLRKQEDVFQRMALALFAQVWIVLPFALMIQLATMGGEYQAWVILGFFILLWTNDTGAYVTGRLFGRNKLAPQISPGKTWEGFAGGVILSFVAAWLIPSVTFVLLDRDWFVIAGIVTFFSNAGDLVESALKRRCGVKDSGAIMPGHGGILDRFDGALLSVPLIVAYLLFTNY